jgi:hypothetical protein
MICSLWRIEFVTRSGAVVLLLDYDEKVESEPVFSIQQSAVQTQSIFAAFGSSYALGGAMTEASWTRYRKFGTNHSARTTGLIEQQFHPWGEQGTLKVSIKDGSIWEFLNSTVSSIQASYPLVLTGGALMQQYQASCGKQTLIFGVLGSGDQLRWSFINTLTWGVWNQQWQTLNKVP